MSKFCFMCLLQLFCPHNLSRLSTGHWNDVGSYLSVLIFSETELWSGQAIVGDTLCMFCFFNFKEDQCLHPTSCPSSI